MEEIIRLMTQIANTLVAIHIEVLSIRKTLDKNTPPEKGTPPPPSLGQTKIIRVKRE